VIGRLAAVTLALAAFRLTGKNQLLGVLLGAAALPLISWLL